MSNVHSTLFAGPLGQLIDMGGPVMVVLLAMAVLGVVTFFYLMLYGTFCTPRRDKRVKQLVSQWQLADGTGPGAMRRMGMDDATDG